ncbi:hypothetical protein [Gordonia paraffinivorans]
MTSRLLWVVFHPVRTVIAWIGPRLMPFDYPYTIPDEGVGDE